MATHYDLQNQAITLSAWITMLKAGMHEEVLKEMENAKKKLEEN